MGSRRFFYFLPAPGQRLDFCKGVRSLDGDGFRFQSPAFVNVLGPSGVLLSAIEHELELPSASAVCGLLNAGKRLDVTCGDTSLALGCSFGSPHTEPLFSVNVSRQSWFRFDQGTRSKYENVLARVAEESGARNVIVIDDPADDFLGNIERIDEQWMVDLQLSDGSEYDASSVWADARTGPLLSLRDLQLTGRRIGSFDEFDERPR